MLGAYLDFDGCLLGVLFPHYHLPNQFLKWVFKIGSQNWLSKWALQRSLLVARLGSTALEVSAQLILVIVMGIS